MLEHLFKLSQQPEVDDKRVDDLIDSLFYEHKIRVKDGISEIDKLQIKNEIITDNQSSVLSKIEKTELHKQHLMKQMSRLKHRQTGQLQKKRKKKLDALVDDSNENVYDCVIDISLLTHVIRILYSSSRTRSLAGKSLSSRASGPRNLPSVAKHC